MSILLGLLQLIQIGSTIAPLIEQLRGKDPTEAERIQRLLDAAMRAIGRGVEGAAYLQTLGAELEALHAQGKTISQADIDSELAGILSVADEIELERRKLDQPPVG